MAEADTQKPSKKRLTLGQKALRVAGAGIASLTLGGVAGAVHGSGGETLVSESPPATSAAPFPKSAESPAAVLHSPADTAATSIPTPETAVAIASGIVQERLGPTTSANFPSSTTTTSTRSSGEVSTTTQPAPVETTIPKFEISHERLQQDGFDFVDRIQAVYDDAENRQGPYTLNTTPDEQTHTLTTVFTTKSQDQKNTYKLILVKGDDGVVQDAFAGIFTTETPERPEHEMSSVRINFTGAMPSLSWIENGLAHPIDSQQSYDQAMGVTNYIVGLGRDAADLESVAPAATP